MPQASTAFAGHPPEPTTCCGRGCNGCVWEGYFVAVDWWREDASELLLRIPDCGEWLILNRWLWDGWKRSAKIKRL